MKILPDEIPDDAAPLTEIPVVSPIDRLNNVLVEGQNVFVTLFTGEFFVGRCEWINDTTFTVGTSNPIDLTLIESGRIV